MKRTFTTLAGLIIFSLLFTVNASFASGTTLVAPGSTPVAPTPVFPVKYISFEGTVLNRSVLLTWVTEESAYPDYFEVERSFNGSDFSKIGLVLDGFAEGGQKAYAFKENADAIRSKGIVYYRLTPIFLKETGAVSKIVAVQFKTESTNSNSITPNPFSDKINMKFPATQEGIAELRIVNATGNTVFTKTYTINKGSNNIQINNLGMLPSGTYIANMVLNGTQVTAQTIIK